MCLCVDFMILFLVYITVTLQINYMCKCRAKHREGHHKKKKYSRVQYYFEPAF